MSDEYSETGMHPPSANNRSDTPNPSTPLDPQLAREGDRPPSKRRREEQLGGPCSDIDERESSRLSTPTPGVDRSTTRRRGGFLNPFIATAGREGTPQGVLMVQRPTSTNQPSQTTAALAQVASSLGRKTPTAGPPSGLAQMAALSMGKTRNPGADSAPAAALTSKGASQALAALKNKIEKLSADVNEHEADIEKNAHAVDNALALAEDASTLAQDLCERVETLETVAASLVDRVQSLEKRVEAASGVPTSSEESDAEDGGEKKRRVKKGNAAKRKNALQDAVRRCMRSFMHIVDSEDLPAPLGGKRFWLESQPVADDGTPAASERRLRPDWERSWADNQAGWLLDVVHRIRENGASYTKTPGATELFAGLTEVQVESAIHTCWKTFVKKYRAQKAEKTKLENDKVTGKIKGRKRAKAKARRDERANVPELAKAEYNHLFQWQYQSTDESTVEVTQDVVDPLTETEGTPTPQQTRKIWVSHAPAYRLETVRLSRCK
ncbi:hypothetical protein FKP32DRAFT_1602181 [Trametes sanguinea]|nr:hypothetical protein FKP32DRAFT_1602181 [Trametes sanguinea]